MPKHSDKSLKNSSLLLAGHGSSKPGGDNPIHTLAETLRAGGLFDAVFEGYLKQNPLLNDVLSDITSDKLFVVPMLTGHGYITDELIPAALSTLSEHTHIHMCEPIGCHPATAELLAGRVRSIISDYNLKRETVSVLLAAHGNSKNPQNAEQVRSLAKAIAKTSGSVAANAAFIEEAPLISDWHRDGAIEDLIVLPYLIGGGLHGAEDVPNMVGLDPQHPSLLALDADTPMTGPLRAHGRRIWYCRTFGHEPELANMIIDLVKEAS